ncbi:F-box/kelch-repeat protein [Artemisia annua]|uniref:F-box/kelch-repeat protein n=1 Tax=Artemisia annua TaxID=35608 RepID=A0A2U1MD93_ARTAN|nr:F-box/kelch-repeat protein [Artemisia annua]
MERGWINYQNCRWLGKRDDSDQNPFCGFSIGAVDGCIYMLGGFSKASSMKTVWKYDPVLNSWNEVNPMFVGRAYCKTGGVSRGRGGLTPLQSAEVFDPQTGLWSELPSMHF